MSSYRLLSFSADGHARAGILVGESVYDLADVSTNPGYATILGVLADWAQAHRLCMELAKTLPESGTGGRPLADVQLLAPILYPSAIYCAGANYTDHVEEMARARGNEPGPTMKDLGERPWHFIKAARAAIVGPGARVKAPTGCSRMDWEIELAVVIGRTCQNVSADNFQDVVAGYMIANDLSARDLGRRTKLEPDALMFYDWIGHKTFNGSCPTGPWITPSQFVPDPNSLDMKLWVNGELMQNSSTRHQIFDVGEQIEALSSQVTLFPGDIILTGTPAGVGTGRNRFLKPGDEIQLWVEELGEFSHSIV